jgi:hypothetical protein
MEITITVDGNDYTLTMGIKKWTGISASRVKYLIGIELDHYTFKSITGKDYAYRIGHHEGATQA